MKYAKRAAPRSILVTRPHGLRQTTTLYTASRTLNQPDENIVNRRNPVEYQLPGVNQVH
jgi:type II secretory ATPase GspE/PulE/Tfp pilus assembly ATPase PilB-like protein